MDASVPAHVVADYEARMPTTQLTLKYGISKASVLRLLREAEPRCGDSPSPRKRVDDAVRLYASGLSVAAIGLRLGAHPEQGVAGVGSSWCCAATAKEGRRFRLLRGRQDGA